VTRLLDRAIQARRHSRVLLITEGSYPFYPGGVSQWCDTLVNGMPEVDFHVLGLVGDPSKKAEYEPPANVASLDVMPVWGVREFLELRTDLTRREIKRLRRTGNDAAVTDGLVPFFRRVVASILTDDTADELAAPLHAMHQFFLEHDFDTAMRSRPVWDAFVEVTSTALPRLAAERGCELPPLNLEQLTQAMLRLSRWLSPLSVRLPRVDVAHSTSGGLGGLVGVIAKLEQGIPFLLTEHGVYLRERYLEGLGDITWVKLFSLAFMRRITELSYLFADQISPGSKFNARWAVRNGAPRLRIRTIYNGVDPATFTPVSRPPGNDPVIVWVGRITPVKDPKTLLHAAALVHGTDPKVRFRIYGQAPGGDEQYYAECLALRETLGLQEVVTFEGYVPSVEAAFNDGDVAVITSITEGFPYTVIEAMLCGRPVIGTAVGGIPEALSDECGTIVMPSNPADLAAGILSVVHMSGEEREAMGRRGRDRAANQFSLSHSLDAYRLSYLLLAGCGNRMIPRNAAANVVGRATRKRRPNRVVSQTTSAPAASRVTILPHGVPVPSGARGGAVAGASPR